jgi:hypothetical protein
MNACRGTKMVKGSRLADLRRMERQFGRELNAKRYSQKEFRDKMRADDHFLKSVMKGKLVTLAGPRMSWKKLDLHALSPAARRNWMRYVRSLSEI